MFTLEIPLTSDALDLGKSELWRHCRDEKSSHRCEALARGLGFRTYATARAVAVGAGATAKADGRAFSTYLAEHGFQAAPRILYLAVARIAIESVLAREPRLTKHGIGTGDPHKKAHNVWENEDDVRARFNDERAFMKSDSALEPFLLALSLVQRVKSTRSIRPGTSAYWIKHIAEDYEATYPEGDKLGPQYVPTGTLIAAALHHGFAMKTWRTPWGNVGQSVRFNMSRRCLDDLNSEIRPDSGRAQDRIRKAEARRNGLWL